MDAKHDYISGQELMRLPALSTSKVLSKVESLEIPIKGANIIEVPDIANWVQPGDIMITTAYPFREDLSQLLMLMEEMSRKGVAGIAIKPKRFIESITQDIIDKSNECKLLLIELGPEAVFSNIVFQTVQAISNKSMWEYLEVQNRIDHVLSNMNNSDSIDKMLELLEVEIQHPIGVLAEEGKLIGLPIIQTQLQDVTKEHYKILKEQALQLNDVELKLPNQLIRFYVKPVGTDENHPILILVNQTEKKLKSYERRVLENVSPILYLQVKNNQVLQKKVKEYRDRFLLDWVKGNIEDTMDILLFAKEYDLNLKKDKEYQVGIISIVETEEKKNLDTNFLKVRHYIQNLKSQFLIAFDGGEFLIILEAQPDEDMECNLQRLLRELEFTMGEKIRISLSNSQPLNLVSIAYEEARKIFDISKNYRIHKAITTFEDLGIFTILSLLPKHEEVDRYVERYLGNLKKYDEKNKGKLVETLIVYFASGENAREASEKLYIHYNTMMYRLEKIKNVLNRNIDDVEIRLQLQVALKIDAMYQKE